jgi:flagellar motor switch protein FliM
MTTLFEGRMGRRKNQLAVRIDNVLIRQPTVAP